MNAALEGDDLPEPIRVWLYGDGFCSIDGELDAIAEATRPESKPLGWIRMQMDVRGGHCLCKKLFGDKGEQMKFGPENTFGKGRPRGSRNKLAKRFFEDMSEVWDELTPDGKSTRGKAALRLMWRERPSDFCKLYAAVMPREFWVESVATDLSDDELEAMIANLRTQVLEAAQELPTLPAPKVIEHAH
jgi:hypothetical protein